MDRTKLWVLPSVIFSLATATVSGWCAFPTLEVENVLRKNGVHVGVTDLSDVQTLYGVATPSQSREHAPKKLCYVGTDLSSPFYVSFEAGPLGGWERITGVTLSVNRTDLDRRTGCVRSEAAERLAKDLIEQGFALGQDKSWFFQRFGKPSHIGERRLEFRQESRIRLAPPRNAESGGRKPGDQEDFDVAYHMIVSLSAGKAVRIRWTKTESN